MSGSHGIHRIDTAFQRAGFDAAYLIVEDGRAAFVDCGTNHSVAHMLAALEAHGLQPGAVDWLILTHVHLDHAGGAGQLMQRLPNARLLVHPRGARHMIDPSRLVAGATEVYGEVEMQRNYGSIQPVTEARVDVAGDGHVVDLAGRRLECMHTPGHARHHLSVWDQRSRSWFTGDTFGLSYREFDTDRGALAIPSSSPVQFEPEPLKDSIRRMLEREPEAMYPTHYGRVGNVAQVAEFLIELVDRMVAIAEAADGRPDRHQRLVAELRALYVERATDHGVEQAAAKVDALLALDIELNAQGLEVWLDRRKAA